MLLSCFRVALRILIKLVLALDSTKVKSLSLIGCCCGCVLRVDFHSTDGITHERRLAFHDLLLKAGVSCYSKRSTSHAHLAHSPVGQSQRVSRFNNQLQNARAMAQRYSPGS